MDSTNTHIIFELADAAYGIRTEDVQHIEMVEHITPVPNTAPAVDGVVFSRGQVIPAINLRARFGLPRQPHTARSRLIFLRVQQRVVALLVDSAREFQKIPPETTRPAPETLHGVSGKFVRGIATVKNRMVLLLDVGAVLSLEEITPPAGAPMAPAHS